jgi:hypothetical protein
MGGVRRNGGGVDSTPARDGKPGRKRDEPRDDPGSSATPRPAAKIHIRETELERFLRRAVSGQEAILEGANIEIIPQPDGKLRIRFVADV